MIIIEIQYSSTTLYIIIGELMHAYRIKTMAPCLSYINYHVKRRCFVTSYVQTIYTAVQTITKLTLFVVSKNEWDIKEGPGKSMKNALYVGQRHLSG